MSVYDKLPEMIRAEVERQINEKLRQLRDEVAKELAATEPKPAARKKAEPKTTLTGVGDSADVTF